MATVRDWLRNTAQKLLDKTTIDENIGRAFNSGRANLQAMGSNLQAGANRVVNRIKSDPLSFTPLSMREQVVPMVRSVIPNQQTADDIGYGLRGALSLSPFQRPGKNLQAYAPTTNRQRMASDIGQTVMGTALTAPLGGSNPVVNIVKRIPEAAVWGAGITTAGTILGQGRLPSVSELGAGAGTGIKNQWQLAITNPLTDKALGFLAPRLTEKGISQALQNKQFQQYLKNLFGRALVESLPENTAWVIANKLNETEQDDLMRAWMRELPGNMLGNIAFAGLRAGGNLIVNRDMQKATGEALQRAYAKTIGRKVLVGTNYDPGSDTYRQLKSVPLWKAPFISSSPGRIKLDEKIDLPKPQSTVGKNTQPTARNTPKELEPLIEEARKYKSAEEFVKAQGTPVYHGSKSYKGGVLNLGSPNTSRGSGIYTTPIKEQAKKYGNLVEIFFDKNAKIFDFDAFSPKQIQSDVISYLKRNNINFKNDDGFIHSSIGSIDTHSKSKSSFNNFIKKAGNDKFFKDLEYDVVKFGEGENQVVVYNPSVIKTKQQLIDIWNKAHQTKQPTLETKQTKVVGAKGPQPATSNKPPFISEQKTKRNRVVGDTNDEKLQRPMTEKGFVDHGQVEIPGAGVAKPKYTKNVIDEQTRQENLTNAVLAEDDPKLFRDIFTRWVGKRNAAKTTGAVEGAKYTDIPRNKGMEFIFHAEGTTKSEDPQIIAKAKQWKADTDRIYADIKAVAKEVGIKDLGYINRYVTHYWKETPKQVNQILTQASRSNPSLRARGIMTYEDGIKLGLTPKYDNPAQIMSEYVRRLEQTKANLDLFKELKDNGLLLTAAEARGVSGFEPINAIGFPKSTANVNGTIVEGAYYAPSKVARQINKIFSPDEGNKVLSIIGEGTRKFQDITLSGGLPGTPLNAFTLAQVQKELLAGRVASPLKAIAVSLNPQKTTKFFIDNADQIKKMQVRDINLSTNLNTKDLVGSIKDGVWDKLMNDPTFKRFMPILQINLFNDIEAQALKSGKGAEEAADIAARAVKNFYGSSSAAKDITTSQNAKNVISSIFFAPKFREAMINFWVNNIKALSPIQKVDGKMRFTTKNITALENRNNLKFMAGAAITYGVMNYLNNRFSGHDMSQNPDGKKDKLLIPLKDGYTLGIPFLSSIATVPRGVVRITSDVISGDYAKAAKDAGQTFLSSTLKPTIDVMNNEDYFGKQIYDPDASTKDKQLAVAKYLGKQFLGHPWIKALIDSKDQPAYQTISKALELPFRFYKSESIANAPFWEEYDRVKKYGQKYNEIYDKNEKVKYYQQHKADIDQYDFMKERVKAYYADNKNSSFLHENTVVGNNVVIADGRIVEMDKFESIKTPPKFTGNKLLDKQLYSTYSGAITSRINDVEALYKAGIVDADQAEKMIGQLETLRKAAKTGSGNSTKAVITAKQLLSAYKKLLDSLGKLKSSRSSRSLKSYMSKTKYPKLKKMPKVKSMV